MQEQRIELLKEMILKEPNDSFLNYALALEYVKENKIDLAIEKLQLLLKNNAQYLAAYYQLGKLLEQTNSKENAIMIYRKGIEIARSQKNTKTITELNEALQQIEE